MKITLPAQIGWYFMGPMAVLTLACVGFDLLGFEVPAFMVWATVGLAALGIVYFVLTQGLLVYVTRRLMETATTVFVICTALFLILRFLPGGPFDREKPLPPEVKANIERKYHLDKPLLGQYGEYMMGLARGDLGESYKYVGRSVSDIILETLPVSMHLGIYALLISYLIGIPLGVFAAAKHNTWFDSGSMFMAISGVSLPSFLVGPIFILLFSFQLGWLPPALWESPIYYILPVLTFGIRPMAFIARLVRATVLEEIGSDFVRTARAKGLTNKVVLYKHVLRNSLIPVLSVSGPLVADVLSGSFVIELIFAVPGIGKHFVQSVGNRDYPLVLGVTLVYSVILIFANMIMDLLYAVFDPRIRLT